MFSHSVVPRLLNMSITASAVIIAVIFVRLLLKKAPRVISYALWGIVLIRLLCPMALQSPASLFELVSPPMNEAGVMEYIPQSIDRQDFADEVSLLFHLPVENWERFNENLRELSLGKLQAEEKNQSFLI